jgi:hypothetical protein
MEYFGLAVRQARRFGSRRFKYCADSRQDVSSDNASARDIRTSCADDIAEFLYATFS